MNRPRVAFVLGVCGMSLALVLGYEVGRARADGPPTTTPLTFSGVLDDGGAPVDGMRTITIRLWDAVAGGTAQCTTVAPGTVVSGGRFRVVLDSTCVGAVRSNPDLWVEVSADSTTFPRLKIGAVPYALEAGRASGSAGPLESRIAGLESRSSPRQVVVGNRGSASYTGSGSITDTTSTVPLDGSVTTFTPTTTGLYNLSALCVMTGVGTASIQVLTTPAPRNYRDLGGGLVDTSSPAPACSSCTTFNLAAVPMPVSSMGEFQAGTPYTVQVTSTLTSKAELSSAGWRSWHTTTLMCGPLIITQLS